MHRPRRWWLGVLAALPILALVAVTIAALRPSRQIEPPAPMASVEAAIDVARQAESPVPRASPTASATATPTPTEPPT
ncbi:MAG TPA: hypothetical protein DEU95_05410, partial [Chloroflexi bacterium]|nr:hypothetical protein [Chloroflexota bacterium]